MGLRDGGSTEPKRINAAPSKMILGGAWIAGFLILGSIAIVGSVASLYLLASRFVDSWLASLLISMLCGLCAFGLVAGRRSLVGSS